MPQSDRVYRIAGYLKSGQCLAPQALWREFSTSPATIKRDIAYMRDRMHLPVVFDRAQWGYRLETQAEADQDKAPSMLISADEAHAVAAARRLLADVTPGTLLADQRDRLVSRLTHLLSVGTRGASDAERRIVVELPEQSAAPSPWFETVATATLQGRRLAIELGSGNGAVPVHEVSPQRLVHRAGRWQLEALDHASDDVLRDWPLDTLIGARMLEAPALSLDEPEVAAAPLPPPLEMPRPAEPLSQG